MKARVLPVAALSMLATVARAETPIQAGEWEKLQKVTLDGTAMPSRPQKACLKAGEASLERLLSITADEAAARGCTSSGSTPGSGRIRLSMTGPAIEGEPEISTTIELKFTPTSFHGSGTVEAKATDHESKGTGLLSGKRIGDC